ncbi:similar to Saccharomyces cerevisiae YBR185C MBA1 Membrane-associated mitochondrial ribosome receptor [Maudiozyma saulgeensis]|uniref:Similar to Saccharomyces cerevisiae YBR185C MBA1 Membrane-associated mitochondrial ribosome receptor n=1 Tax=Maudiozyma saulgeensis TaxID=1789683 RepID=A0A1X7R1N1_9SACH|nr:similar to Saccharomyces cerevisiae YBR185C MBA1 Membrane-associated mitochondrial ribosome receptor [Kazachstania saulgeensis]
MSLLRPAVKSSYMTTRSTISIINQTRLISRSIQVFQESKDVEEKQKKKTPKKNDTGNNFNPRYLGVTANMYIPTSYKNLPNVLINPIAVFNSLIRRCYTFGFNTFKVALFRFQTGTTPKFLLWKNKAIESYIQVNKAFANKNIKSISPGVSLWVEEALNNRVTRLPKNLILDWQILKFNNVPKLVSIEPIMMPGKPLENIQLVYRFDTQQELIKFDQNTEKTEKQIRDIVDYMVFLCDTTTDQVILIGSVFESKPNAKLPKNSDVDRKQVVKNMRLNGDIFRQPPN